MDNIKDDAYFLNKMLDDLRFLIEHTKGKTYEQVESDPVLIDSIMFRLIQIAENSDRLTPRIQGGTQRPIVERTERHEKPHSSRLRHY